MSLRVHDIVDRPKAQVRQDAAYTLQLKAFVDGTQRTNSSITAATISITMPGGAALPTPVEDAVVSVAAGGTMSYSLAAGNTATLGERYRAVWSYTDTSIVYEHVQLFDVVRFPLYAVVVQSDLVAHHKDLTDYLFSGESNFNTYIEEAFSDVYRTIENRGKRPYLMLASEELRRPVEHLALAKIAFPRIKAEGDKMDRWFKQHTMAHDAWFAGQQFAYDEDDDGVVEEEEAKRPVGQPSYRI